MTTETNALAEVVRRAIEHIEDLSVLDGACVLCGLESGAGHDPLCVGEELRTALAASPPVGGERPHDWQSYFDATDSHPDLVKCARCGLVERSAEMGAAGLCPVAAPSVPPQDDALVDGVARLLYQVFDPLNPTPIESLRTHGVRVWDSAAQAVMAFLTARAPHSPTPTKGTNDD